MSKRKTPAQNRAEAERVARLARETVRLPSGRSIEQVVVDTDLASRGPSFFSITVTFAGTGLAPFREARYTPAEVLRMIGL